MCDYIIVLICILGGICAIAWMVDRGTKEEFGDVWNRRKEEDER